MRKKKRNSGTFSSDLGSSYARWIMRRSKVKVPGKGYCVRLPSGGEICRDGKGFYAVSISRSWMPANLNPYRVQRRKREYKKGFSARQYRALKAKRSRCPRCSRQGKRVHDQYGGPTGMKRSYTCRRCCHLFSDERPYRRYTPKERKDYLFYSKRPWLSAPAPRRESFVTHTFEGKYPVTGLVGTNPHAESALIRNIVGQQHVGMGDQEVINVVARRLGQEIWQIWPASTKRKVVNMIKRYHHENQRLYRFVMTGRNPGGKRQLVLKLWKEEFPRQGTRPNRVIRFTVPQDSGAGSEAMQLARGYGSFSLVEKMANKRDYGYGPRYEPIMVGSV